MIRSLLLTVLLLAACSTPQITATCIETQRILQVAKPFLAFAPPEVQMAVWALSAGTVACSTPEYAAAREKVIGWLRSRGARL